MTWFDGLVDGVINIITRDFWPNCPDESGFYFECFSANYELAHDLNDWQYVTQW